MERLFNQSKAYSCQYRLGDCDSLIKVHPLSFSPSAFDTRFLFHVHFLMWDSAQYHTLLSACFAVRVRKAFYWRLVLLFLPFLRQHTLLALITERQLPDSGRLLVLWFTVKQTGGCREQVENASVHIARDTNVKRNFIWFFWKKISLKVCIGKDHWPLWSSSYMYIYIM